MNRIRIHREASAPVHRGSRRFRRVRDVLRKPIRGDSRHRHRLWGNLVRRLIGLARHPQDGCDAMTIYLDYVRATAMAPQLEEVRHHHADPGDALQKAALFIDSHAS